jgi:peptidoglycan/xylan/chitin deacetylase (PgdA/CDA1 family)
MKKLVFIICLAALFIVSGCTNINKGYVSKINLNEANILVNGAKVKAESLTLNNYIYVSLKTLREITKKTLKWEVNEEGNYENSIGQVEVPVNFEALKVFSNNKSFNVDAVKYNKVLYYNLKQFSEAASQHYSIDDNGQTFKLEDMPTGELGAATLDNNNIKITHKENINETIIDDFENIEDWTVYNGTKSSDTKHVRSGSKALQITAEASDKPVVVDKQLNNKLDKSEYTSIWFYIEDVNALNYMSIYLSSNNFEKSYFRKDITSWKLSDGWNYFKIKNTEWENQGMESWSNNLKNMRISIYSAEGQKASVTIDSFFTANKTASSFLLMFDDGYDDMYNVAFKYCKERNIPLTLAVISSFVGTDDYMTANQLKETYTAGWDIVNHTSTHRNLNGFSKDEIIKEIEGCRSFLKNNGFDRSSDFVVYPEGKQNAFIHETMKELGIKAARGTVIKDQYLPIDNIYNLKMTVELRKNTTFEEVKQAIDKSIDQGAVCTIVGHKIEESPTDDISVSIEVFKKVIDYLNEKNIKCTTLSRWYEEYNKGSSTIN